MSGCVRGDDISSVLVEELGAHLRGSFVKYAMTSELVTVSNVNVITYFNPK